MPGHTARRCPVVPDDVLPALGLQVGEAAAQLGVDRTTLPKVLNGSAVISPAMALRSSGGSGGIAAGQQQSGWPSRPHTISGRSSSR
jgi:hypothetical protein